MSTIVTRQGKGSPLTNAEVDSNFVNLNNDKLDANSPDVLHTSNLLSEFDTPEEKATARQNLGITNEIPAGGTVNSILVKNSTTDGDIIWSDSPTLDAISFDTTAAETSAVGKLAWNEAEGTLEFGLKGGNVTLQIGQKQTQPVVNKSGSTLLDGTVVYISGAQGNRLTVQKASAASEVSSTKTFGVVTETIANNGEGFITTTGLVRNIDTSTFLEGATLWLGTNGQFTNVKPSAPNHMVLVGWVARSHAVNGSIFVHIQNGYELDELHDVLITDRVSGDIIRWNSLLNAWENTQLGNAADLDVGTTSGTVAAGDHNHSGLYEEISNKGQANGYASLDIAGKVPSSQLPSYVDDVLEYANFVSLPVSGVQGIIYVTIDSNKTYRWSGSAYIEISPSPGTTDSLAEGSTNLYFTTGRARNSLSGTGVISYDSGTGVISSTAEANVNADWNAISGDALILNKPVLGTASAQNVDYFATASQGIKADTAVQPADIANMLETGDIGVSVQAFNSNIVIDGSYVHTDNNYTTAEKNKLAGIAVGAEVNVNADWNATSGDAQILNKPPLATVATSGSYTDLTNKPTITSGTVTSTSVVNANGFSGSVATATTTPAITLTTSVNGIIKGNGTAISAATANTDYLAPALANTAVTGFKTATFDSQTSIATTTGAITINWTTAQNQRQVEPTGTITYTFTAPPGPCHLQLIIDSDGTSTAQTINWPASVIWLNEAWAGVNNKKAVINFWYDGTNYYAISSNQA